MPINFQPLTPAHNPPSRMAAPTACLVVCLPACLPACFCVSCICVGRSSQLNESSRFTRFGVLRRSPKARGNRKPEPAGLDETPLQIPLNLGTFFQPNLAFGRRRTDGLRLCLCQASRPPWPAIWSLCHGDKLNLPGFEMSQASRAVPTSGYLPPPLTRRISGSRLVPALPRQTAWVAMPGQTGPRARARAKPFPADPAGRSVAKCLHHATAFRRVRHSIALCV